MQNLKNAFISGIGELKPQLHTESTTLDLLAQSAALAIQDAGITKKDIDGLLVTAPSEDTGFMWPAQAAEYLQIFPHHLDMVELGGASAVGAVARAALLVASGICRHCLCLSGGVWDSQVFNTREGKTAVMSQAEIDYELPVGPMGFNSGYALVARRHMYEFGTKPEQLAKIAVDQRKSALLNPDALYNSKELTIEEVMSSRVIVDPIHLLEIVRPCSGAAAVIVSQTEEAGDRPRVPVFILGMGEACTHNSIIYAPTLTTSPVKMAAKRAFAMAGVTPDDIDLLSLYDCYPITVLISIEDAGFCPKGMGGDFVQSQDLSYMGKLPCNTHGGQLCCGQASYAGGMSHLTEAVRQLRGEAGLRQISNNRLAFVNGNGGVFSTECSMILGRK
ncbi:MAG: thiolase family protein [Syntrophomonadaceae bacterium]|nr:thiolase family protein [Syntrophomonadaceae bacterium]